MSKNTKFNGTGVAIVTPFSKDNSIDYKSLGKLVDFIIKGVYMVKLFQYFYKFTSGTFLPWHFYLKNLIYNTFKKSITKS